MGRPAHRRRPARPHAPVLVQHQPQRHLLPRHGPPTRARTPTQLALRGTIPARLQVARDGQEALDYLFNQANELPQLVLLDLGLPNLGGLEALRRIRENERTRLTPVVILTSSTAPDDIATGYRSGANSYVCKSLDFDQFSGLVRQLASYWLTVNEPPPNTSHQLRASDPG